MSDTLFEELVQMQKASAYDIINPEYKRLQEVNKELLEACKKALSFLKAIEVRGDCLNTIEAAILKAPK